MPVTCTARSFHYAWTIEADYLSANSVSTNSADLLLLRRNEPAHPVFDAIRRPSSRINGGGAEHCRECRPALGCQPGARQFR
jgi:hypothetical protein